MACPGRDLFRATFREVATVKRLEDKGDKGIELLYHFGKWHTFSYDIFCNVTEGSETFSSINLYIFTIQTSLDLSIDIAFNLLEVHISNKISPVMPLSAEEKSVQTCNWISSRGMRLPGGPTWSKQGMLQYYKNARTIPSEIAFVHDLFLSPQSFCEFCSRPM